VLRVQGAKPSAFSKFKSKLTIRKSKNSMSKNYSLSVVSTMTPSKP